MNAEMYVAERMADNFHKRGNLSWGGGILLLYYRLSPAVYATCKKKPEDFAIADKHVGDDPIAVAGCWKELGVPAAKTDITKAGYICTLLSGTTYSILRGFYKSFSEGGRFNATPLQVYDFRVPDVFPYITSHGVSYKLVSDYKLNDWITIIFGAETVMHGKSASEFSLGIDTNLGQSLNNVSCKLVTTFGKGLDVQATCSCPISNRFSINFGVSSYSSKSLVGERHAKNMKNGTERSTSAFVSVSYHY
jgi:hypothetical protein